MVANSQDFDRAVLSVGSATPLNWLVAAMLVCSQLQCGMMCHGVVAVPTSNTLGRMELGIRRVQKLKNQSVVRERNAAERRKACVLAVRGNVWRLLQRDEKTIKTIIKTKAARNI